jgi:hypothetical protein
MVGGVKRLSERRGPTRGRGACSLEECKAIPTFFSERTKRRRSQLGHAMVRSTTNRRARASGRALSDRVTPSLGGCSR